MDETLIKVESDRKDLPNYDAIISFKFQNRSQVNAYLKFRPFMHKMLEKLAEEFELIVFTSGEPNYANAAIDCIEKNQKFFSYRLTKEHCIKVNIPSI